MRREVTCHLCLSWLCIGYFRQCIKISWDIPSSSTIAEVYIIQYIEYNINDGKKFCFLYLFRCKVSWLLVSKSFPLFHMRNLVFFISLNAN
jgi:hypothetical protein